MSSRKREALSGIHFFMIVLSVGIGLGVLGCSGHRPGIISDDEVFRFVELNQGGIRSFQGAGSAWFEIAGQKGSVEATVMATQANDLRIETANFFGFPLTSLILRQGALTYYVVPEKTIYQGRASEFSSQVLPLGITDVDLLGLVLLSEQTVRKFRRHGEYQLVFFEFEPDREGALFYPGGFRLTHRKSREFLEVRWDDYVLNPSLSPALFHLSWPDDVKVISWKQGTVSPLLRGYEGAK